MQHEELVQQLMALSLPERVVVAQELWQSIDESLSSGPSDEHQDAVQAALRRDRELTSGAVVGRSHEEVSIQIIG